MDNLSELHPPSATGSADGSLWRTTIPVMFLIALTLYLYSPALSFPFTNWDDIEFISENPCLRAPTAENIKRILTPGAVPGEMIYIPATYFSFLLERVFFSPAPGVVHATNVLLHISNALLVFYFIGSLLKNSMAALVVAVLFSVHPLVVEPVVWAMGRKDLLSTAFGLLSLIFFRNFVIRGRMRSYFLSLIVFAIALLAKPSLITLPLILVGVHAYIHRSLRTFRWALLIPFLSVCILAYISNSLMPDQSLDGPNTMVRLIYVPWILTGWGLRLLLINRPSPFYSWPSEDEFGLIVASGFAGLIFILLFISIAVKFRKINALSGALFYLVAFIPAIVVIFDARDFVTADRYGYFPLIGVFFVIASVLVDLRSGWRRRIAVAVVSIFVGLCMLRTSQQIDVWSSSEKLWRRALQDCPRVALIRNNLGLALIETGRDDEAIEQFKIGIKLDSGFGAIYNNLGRLYFERQEFTSATAALKSAVALNSYDKSALKNLGDLYAAQEQLDLAQSYYARAIHVNPEFIAGYIGLGNSLNQRGKLSEAAHVYDQALAIDPRSAELYFNLGIVREKEGKLEKAISCYRQAINYRLGFPDAHYNLGNLYHSQGALAKAESSYLSALEFDNGKVEAIINLGNLYLEANRLDLAEQYYRRAITVSATKYPAVHYNLGVILSQKNNLTGALTLFQTTQRLKPDYAPAHLKASQICFQLKDYPAALRHCEAAVKHGLDVDEEYQRELRELLLKEQR